MKTKGYNQRRAFALAEVDPRVYRRTSKRRADTTLRARRRIDACLDHNITNAYLMPQHGLTGELKFAGCLESIDLFLAFSSAFESSAVYTAALHPEPPLCGQLARVHSPEPRPAVTCESLDNPYDQLQGS